MINQVHLAATLGCKNCDYNTLLLLLLLEISRHCDVPGYFGRLRPYFASMLALTNRPER